jgi:putative ABC transport system permease protein
VIDHLVKLVWNRKRSSALLILEIFVSFIVLFAVFTAGLPYLYRARLPLGFSYDNLYTITAQGSELTKGMPLAEQRARVRMILDELRTMPATVAAGGVSVAPFELVTATYDLEFENRRVEGEAVDMTDEAARALGIVVTRGRWFTASDDTVEWTPTVINQAMATRLFGDRDPIGRTVRREPHCRVAGVVEHFRRGGILAPAGPASIRRISLSRRYDTVPRQLVVRVRPGTSPRFQEQAGERIRGVAPDWPFQIESTDSVRRRALRLSIAPLAAAVLVASFLMIMVVLGMIGVFWLSVTRRTHEIGLRRAFGSTRGGVYRQLIAEIFLLASVGSVAAMTVILQLSLIGLLKGFGVWRVATGLTAALGATYALAMASGLYPARLAARVEPAQALHYE